VSDGDGLRPGEPLDSEPGPAEARLGDLLEALRIDPPEPGRGLAVRVVERARWQAALRSVIRVVGQFAGAAGGVGRMLTGRRSR